MNAPTGPLWILFDARPQSINNTETMDRDFTMLSCLITDDCFAPSPAVRDSSSR
jgi:hypothetical protein